jgi:hypothetical protein
MFIYAVLVILLLVCLYMYNFEGMCGGFDQGCKCEGNEV